jgi:hypothetical protein
VRFKAIRKGGSIPADRRLENEVNHALVILVLRPDQAVEIDAALQCGGPVPMFPPREPAAPRRPDHREPRGPESHNWRATRSCRSETAPGSIRRGSARAHPRRRRAMQDRPRSTRQKPPARSVLMPHKPPSRVVAGCGTITSSAGNPRPRLRRDYNRLNPVACH